MNQLNNALNNLREKDGQLRDENNKLWYVKWRIKLKDAYQELKKNNQNLKK